MRKMTCKKRSVNQPSRLFLFLCTAPTLILTVYFILVPTLKAFVLSFTDSTMLGINVHFVGLDNYVRLFAGQDPYFYKSLTVTVIYVVLSVPTSIVFAFLIASLLNKSVKGKGLFRTLFYLPSIIPIVAMGAIWMWIFNPDVGLANSLLKAVGMPPNKWLSSESTVLPTLVLVNLWTTGSTMVIFLAGMQDVPRQLIEAVEIDGGGVLAKMFHVIVPIMTPTIFYNVVMGFINGFQIFTQSYVMTQGGPNNASLFYVYYLYRESFQFMRMGNSCAIAWILFVIIMILTAILFKFQNRWVYYGGE